MNNAKSLLPLILGFLISLQSDVLACSMYKITDGNKTIVGCNEDAWRTTSRIWFENAKNNLEYGIACTGSRQVGLNKFAPQSGMNEAGLVFSRLTSYHPLKSNIQEDKKKIKNEVSYLTEILHKCATIRDVSDFIKEYDHSIFIDDVFIYVDSTGKYLVVEPYNLIEGDDAHYVLSNFCPSITEYEKARKLERYSAGVDFLKTHEVEASLSFGTALSDTMHVCRSRNGDGTLLTSIWDSKNGLVNLFFYHSFESTAQFNLSDELAKGDHILNVASLFPVNPEFERLSNYKTPFNTPALRFLLVILAGILALISLILSFVFIKDRNTGKSINILLMFLGLNLLTIFFFFVLATNINIYYFDAPYKHYTSRFFSVLSYLPFLMLISLIPILIYIWRFNVNQKRRTWIMGFLLANSIIYMVSVIVFGYWGFFNIF